MTEDKTRKVPFKFTAVDKYVPPFKKAIQKEMHRDKSPQINKIADSLAEDTGFSLPGEGVLPLLDFFDKAIPSVAERRYLLGFIASMVQQPQYKSDTIPLLCGDKGCGKGFIVDMLIKKLMPPELIYHSSTGRELIGGFTSFLQDIRLLVVDEFLGISEKKVQKRRREYQEKLIAFLKGIVTKSTHKIRKKGKDTMEVKSSVNVIAISNHKFFCGEDESLFQPVRMILPFEYGSKGGSQYFKELAEFIENNIDIITTYFLQR